MRKSVKLIPYTIEIKKICVIPKVFPYDSQIQAMKLTKSKILEIIRRKNDGWTTYQMKNLGINAKVSY